MKKGKNADQKPDSVSGEQENLSGGQTDAVKVTGTGAPVSQSEAGPENQADPSQELRSALAAKESDFTQLSDKYLRLAAEYENFRRRSQKEKDALYSDSVALVIKELLPVLDNLDRAGLSAARFESDDARQIAEGIDMIKKQADQSLARLGVSVIECTGKPFDPELHEAVMHVEDESVGAAIVVAEIQKGYRRDDRIIRHSMVKVAN